METPPRLIRDIDELRQFTAKLRLQGRSIALVPTMGALHQGHLSLIQLAAGRADSVLVSIFVNPTQFGPNEDLDTYPRDLRGDLDTLTGLGVTAVFAPDASDVYLDGFCSYVVVEGLTAGLCGRSRPTHFRGVTTVVAKLFNLVGPDVAVFGQKDYQQLVVIRRMTRDLDFPVEIVAAPTVRERDGLAMSSRNARLTPSQRKAAPAIHRALVAVRERYSAGERDASRLLELARKMIEAQEELGIDYLELVDPETLHPLGQAPNRGLEGPVHMVTAVFAGATRLIDNLSISEFS